MGKVERIEYAGYLLGKEFGASDSHPKGKGYGGASTHPQFEHMRYPPEGYIFTQEPLEKDLSHLNLIETALNEISTLELNSPESTPSNFSIHVETFRQLAKRTIELGGSLEDFAAFMKGRNLPEQSMLPFRTQLAFIPTVPYSLGLTPWVIEIEDSTTLFYPDISNGNTGHLEVKDLRFFSVIKALLESTMCRAIITHIRSTADSLPLLFESEIIKRKVVYSPLGISLPKVFTTQKKPSDPLNLLFTNSWNQTSAGFYLRGGQDVLEAFSRLSSKYSNVNLIIRSEIPDLISAHEELIRNHPRIRVIDHFMSDAKLEELMLGTDLYLIPAARIHVVSALKALSYGIPVIASDGWGFSEHITDGVTGYLVPGRYGVCSWLDKATGILREDYSSINGPDKINAEVVEGLVEKISYLIDNPHQLSEMKRNARISVETKFSLEQWNRALQETFDKALTGTQYEHEVKTLKAEIEAERFYLQYKMLRDEISALKTEYDALSSDSIFHPSVVEEYKQFNIVLYRKKYYGLPQWLGPIEIDTLTLDQLRDLDGVFTSLSIQDLKSSIRSYIALYENANQLQEDKETLREELRLIKSNTLWKKCKNFLLSIVSVLQIQKKRR